MVTSLAWDRPANSNLVPATALLFASGYLLVWCGFSLAATLLQWGLDNAGLLSERMAFGDAILASSVLIAAGVYQWTPLKDACLRHCRSPTEFLVRHWQPGSLGAVGTGVRHGLFCLGCCWMLMALLFVGGLMSVTWIGAISLFVLIEKTIPWGDCKDGSLRSSSYWRSPVAPRWQLSRDNSPTRPIRRPTTGSIRATGAVMAAEEMVVSACSTLNRTSPDRCTEARGVPRNSAAAR